MKLEIKLELKSDGVVTMTAYWEEDTSLQDLQFILDRLDQIRDHTAFSMGLTSPSTGKAS